MVKMVVMTSPHAETIIRGVSALNKVSLSRLIAIAIDHELERDKPFEYKLPMPERGEKVEYAYAEQSVLILDYMKTIRGAGLDTLAILRHDIGIPDKTTFLAAFKECLDVGALEVIEPPLVRGERVHPEGYKYYQVYGQKSGRSRKMKSKKYDTYLKLKKEFEAEG